MALPRIILIDDNPARGQQFLAVIQFLEYRGELYSAENFSDCGLKIITSLSLRFPDFQRK
jgi:hypothetical protein